MMGSFGGMQIAGFFYFTLLFYIVVLIDLILVAIYLVKIITKK